MRRSALPATLLAALAIGACGTESLDIGKAESEIEKGLRDQLGAKDASVDCPDEVEVKKGDQFDCKASVDRQKGTINVTQQDDEGNVRWQVKQPSTP